MRRGTQSPQVLWLLGALLGALSVTLLGGCATSRSELQLATPVAPAPLGPGAGRTVVFRSVTDERVFEQAPHLASIPSLGFGGAQEAAAEVKARAVGRKRGGFGKAMGDVLLEEGQTVAGVIRESLTAAFQQAGYQVATAETAGPNPLLMDVHIKQFWAWLQPGFWAITLHGDIETELEVAGSPKSFPIAAHVEESRQFATEGAWLDILQQARQAYQTATVAILQTPPF